MDRLGLVLASSAGSEMDHEFDKALSAFDIKASHIFRDFMTRITKIDELTSVGSQLLLNFHQELEFFRRPPLQKTSNVVQDIIDANQTARMKKYIESGFRHDYMDRLNLCKLNRCQQGLQDHLIKVKAQLDELECLSEDGIAVMQAVNQRTSCSLDNCLSDSSQEVELGSDQIKCSNEENETVSPPGGSILLRAILMRDVYNMLKLDFEMQRRVVLSLNLNSSSEELESYCLMLDLRPFINDDIMQQCWLFISQ